MSDDRLYVWQNGLFAGEFVITNQQRSFSIGDYIEVVLREQPYTTEGTVKDLYDVEKPIIVFPLTVVESCLNIGIDVVLRRPVGPISQLLFDCLVVGKMSIITTFKMQHCRCTWYVPKIDGWVPGLFGKTQAPSVKNLVQRREK